MVETDPQVTMLATVTMAVGFLMVQSGFAKSMLELKRRRRVCHSCGRNLESCGC